MKSLVVESPQCYSDNHCLLVNFEKSEIKVKMDLLNTVVGAFVVKPIYETMEGWSLWISMVVGVTKEIDKSKGERGGGGS